MEKPDEKKWDGNAFRHNFTVYVRTFYSLSAFEPLAEEKTLGKHNQVCAENHQNDVKETLDDASKPDHPLEQTSNEKECALKPKMLKFKKVKDGRLSFAGSKNYTKLHQKESECIHVSPLKFVGNDPETESQTLRGYLDEDCEPAVVKAEQVDGCSAVGCSGDDSGQKERGFLASLQEADIECVAVVCKRTSNVMNNRCRVSDDSAGESVKQEVNDGIDGRHKIRQDSKGDEELNAIKIDFCNTPGKTLENVSSIMSNDSSCKRDGVDQRTSPQNQYSEEGCNQMETDSIIELENSYPSCSQSKECMSRHTCTEAGILNQGKFAGENNGDLEPLSVIDNATGDSVSYENGPSSKSTASSCIDEDSSDDFQVSSIRNPQVAPPTCIAEKSGKKTKKRNGTKKCKNKTVMPGVGGHQKSQKLPAEWSCSACTFINDGQLLECTICLTPRVAIEESSSAPNKADVGSKIFNGQSRDDEEMEQVEEAGVSKLRGHLQNSKPTINNSGQDFVVVCDKTQITEPGLPPWSCSACTFFNLSEMIECSICLTPRRRSQRWSVTKNTNEVERQEKDYLNKNKSNKRKRWEGDRVKDKNKQEIDVLVDSFSVTDRDESIGVNSIPHCDRDTSVADPEGLTPEPTELSRDTDSRLKDSGLEVKSSQDGPGGIKSNLRKRLKLEEVEADSTNYNNDISDEIGDFSDDSDSFCQKRSPTCHSTVPSRPDQKEPAPFTPVDKDVTSSEDCFLSADDDIEELKPRQKTDCCLNGTTNNLEVYSDKPVVSANSLGAMSSSKNNSAVPSSEVDSSDNSLSCQQSGSNMVEDLEDLKAAAEELFTSEWEDDDSWWEGESCSGQSSLTSSNEAASSSPAITSPGFTKCSDLYSITELQKKVQRTPEQPKTFIATAVDNVQHFELTASLDNKMPSSPVTHCSFTAETAVVLEEEEEDDPDDIPEAMKLKFCLSLYTERVYLYNEVNYLTCKSSDSLKYFYVLSLV